ncbi:MAG TPA: histidine kinase dimerization/phosphoacceptor domain -containing protein [Puia sp.]|uniref:histidine kinase dimerization/phosphoacceptor domain -containing protein n=1 Tax=Puia sp. TaxID=2045100 RepID=UPI002C92A675|nr:histidine kinase dimerization/phosphoacceptor domain -containing protein [Puia sp.]HVU94487.1 histidine kinase dimerization/phosphoacceptor domain -containing protein [Puia sp.]
MMKNAAFILLSLLTTLHSQGQQAAHYRQAYKMDSLQHEYKSAVENHIQYMFFDDSEKKADQRKKMEQLLIKYSTQKKDRDIRLLRHRQLTEQARINQNRLTRGIMITGAGMMIFIIGLLYRQYRIRQRGNTAIWNSNRRLRQVIDEKERLLKEVHHRVKNNLHTIICLLESQSRHLNDDALEAIEISQHRIYAISLVHQHLYQSADIQTVDMRDFVRDYVHYLSEGADPRLAHRLIQDMGTVKLDVMHAVPVALMINEALVELLASCSASGNEPEIRIFLQQVGDRIVLRITGNGNYASPGVNLIRKLSETIGADLTLPAGKDTHLQVVFDKYSIYSPSLRTSSGKKNGAIVTAALTIGALGFLLSPASGQKLSAAETVKNYSLAQKRLLVINMLQFTNLISQNSLDQDSLMAISCRFTGMPFLLPYSEGIEADSQGRIPQLLANAMRYLHRAGTHKKDLDSTALFIDSASRGIRSEHGERWVDECAFIRAEWYRQKREVRRGRSLLIGILAKSRSHSNALGEARACRLLAGFSDGESLAALEYRKRALEIYKQLRMPELQIQMLMDIFASTFTSESSPSEQILRQILFLMDSTGFRHRLFAENFLAYILLANYKNAEGLDVANAALEDMRWSGIDQVQGSFWIRLGAVYESLDKNREALDCFRKAIARGTAETHLFWYKGLFYAATLMNSMGDGQSAIALIDTVTGKFPPITVWEKLQVISMRGECYDQMRKVDSADKYYMALLRFVDGHPDADTYGEFSTTFWEIARFYISIGQLNKATLFAGHADPDVAFPTELNYFWYQFRFAMDSATGKFKLALKDHIRYKESYDSAFNFEQKKIMDELAVRNDAEKKDQDLRFLQQQSMIRQAQLRRDELARGLIFGGIASLLLIASLLFHQYRLKQRTYREMKRKNHLLQGLIKEKAWLLKEVQLRVNDNLQTVISLLGVQAADLHDDALNAIDNSQRRIYAMSLIHQKLLDPDCEKAIDMSEYIAELVRYLESSFGTDGNIRFELDIQPVKLGASQAVAVAMIVNEATTNAIKYAFPGFRTGTITIQMTRVDRTITMVIADDGVGMSQPASNDPSKTLGIKLMRGLSEDLGAAFTIRTDKGTSVILQMDAGRILETM